MNEIDDKPTELTLKDFDNFMKDLYEDKYNVKQQTCHCGKEFYRNYSIFECDGCYFAKWPKEQREAFYRSFFE